MATVTAMRSLYFQIDSTIHVINHTIFASKAGVIMGLQFSHNTTTRIPGCGRLVSAFISGLLARSVITTGYVVFCMGTLYRIGIELDVRCKE